MNLMLTAYYPFSRRQLVAEFGIVIQTSIFRAIYTFIHINMFIRSCVFSILHTGIQVWRRNPMLVCHPLTTLIVTLVVFVIFFMLSKALKSFCFSSADIRVSGSDQIGYPRLSVRKYSGKVSYFVRSGGEGLFGYVSMSISFVHCKFLYI